MLIHGSCHCRNLTFELTWDPDPAEIPARACDCSFCTKHGGVWTSNPRGTLTVSVEQPALVSKYAFGTNTAVFHICSRCGIVPVVTCDIDHQLHAVVNVNTFNDVAPSLVRRAPISLDDENVESRLARRKRGWIAKVAYVESSST